MNTQNFSVGEVELSYKRKKFKTEKISTADDAFHVLRSTFSDGQIGFKEFFKILLLDNAHNVLGWSLIGEGGLTECPVDVRLIFQTALLSNATRIIVCHNHPSGSLKPSKQDDNLTSELKQAGKLLRIPVVDHIILSEDRFYSYADEGRIQTHIKKAMAWHYC